MVTPGAQDFCSSGSKVSVPVVSQEILHGLLLVVFPLLDDKSLPMSSLLCYAVGYLCHPNMTSSF